MYAYYAVMNDHAQFLADLHRLNAEIPPFRVLRPDQSSDSDPHVMASEGAMDLSTDEDDGTVDRRTELLWAFAAKWRLPGVVDLEYSLRMTALGQPLRLQPAGVLYRRSPITSTLIHRAADGTESREEEFPPRIHPFQPEAFKYDPIMDTPGWVRERAKEIAKTVFDSIIVQAKELERRAGEQGWRPIPPHHRDKELQRLARRLFRAAVLGEGNETIVGAEAREHAHDGDYKPCTPQAVSKSVNAWARDLGIRLPKR